MLFRSHPLPVLWRRGAGSPGFVWRPRRGPPAGGRVDGACGLPGTAAALGPLAQCRGRGAGRGCGPGGGCSRLSRFLSSPRLSLAALGGPPGSSLVSARSGLETELSARSPSPWAGNGGRGRVDPEKRASWKWAKRKAWAYENKCGNSRGPECVQEKLPVDRCGFEIGRAHV